MLGQGGGVLHRIFRWDVELSQGPGLGLNTQKYIYIQMHELNAFNYNKILLPFSRVVEF